VAAVTIMSYSNITVAVRCKIQLVEVIVFTEATVVKTTDYRGGRLGCLKCSYGHERRTVKRITLSQPNLNQLYQLLIGSRIYEGPTLGNFVKYM